jgi:hypothetical protein
MLDLDPWPETDIVQPTIQYPWLKWGEQLWTWFKKSWVWLNQKIKTED